MIPTIEVRNQPSPWRWGAAQAGMSWHHIIPCSCLTRVWNVLVNRVVNSQAAEARTALRQFLLLCDRTFPNVDGMLDKIRIMEPGRAPNSHNRTTPLEVHEVMALQTAASWPAWNAVEGWKNRSDDVGDDYMDRFFYGLTLEEKARMRHIEDLYNLLLRFGAAGDEPPIEALRGFIDEISAYRRLLNVDMPIRYRPEMWAKDGDKWRKRRDTGE